MSHNPYLESWTGEKQSAFLYDVMQMKEGDTPAGRLFKDLKSEAEDQAKTWENKMKSPPVDFVPNFRVRNVASLIRFFGVRPIKPILVAMKVRGLSIYTHSHHDHPQHEKVEEVGSRHQVNHGGNLRAAVFGINDGLVSNASLILGISGASSDPKFVLLSGIAGLLAGAFSMAAGEYISVRSQKEMYEHQINLEKKELEAYPEEEAQELALIYQARGLDADEALNLAKKLISNPKRALDALAREELGLNLDELGSPWGAALFSFLAFSTGALIPLVPFLFLSHPQSLFTSIGLSVVALFSVGSFISFFTGKNALWSGFRMLIIGAFAGVITYWLGRYLGVSLG